MLRDNSGENLTNPICNRGVLALWRCFDGLRASSIAAAKGLYD